MLDVCLLGSGGMMPLPYRWLTSLMTRLNGSNLLIDCGEGTQIAIREKGWSVKPLDTICITHFHGDHIGGLPGLLLTMGNAERTEPLTIIGPQGLKDVVNALRVVAPVLPFPIIFEEIRGAEQVFVRNGYKITAFRVNHNIPCYGYNIEVERAGRFDLERAKAADIPMPYWSRLQKGEIITENGRTFRPEDVLGPARRGIKVTYVTDTRPTESIAKHAKDADLFICEGMYGEQDKMDKALEHKHMTFTEAAKLAKSAQPKKLWLTHYSPSLSHPEDYMDQVRSIFPNASPGKDGKTIELDFTEES